MSGGRFNFPRWNYGYTLGPPTAANGGNYTQFVQAIPSMTNNLHTHKKLDHFISNICTYRNMAFNQTILHAQPAQNHYILFFMKKANLFYSKFKRHDFQIFLSAAGHLVPQVEGDQLLPNLKLLLLILHQHQQPLLQMLLQSRRNLKIPSPQRSLHLQPHHQQRQLLRRRHQNQMTVSRKKEKLLKGLFAKS